MTGLRTMTVEAMEAATQAGGALVRRAVNSRCGVDRGGDDGGQRDARNGKGVPGQTGSKWWRSSYRFVRPS
jgi:hypothetical protein